MGANRTIRRSIARKAYDKFSRAWREEVFMTGRKGKKGTRKPTFNLWYGIHGGRVEDLKQSTPRDVTEFLHTDPWVETNPIVLAASDQEQTNPDRGITTIQITGDDE